MLRIFPCEDNLILLYNFDSSKTIIFLAEKIRLFNINIINPIYLFLNEENTENSLTLAIKIMLFFDLVDLSCQLYVFVVVPTVHLNLFLPNKHTEYSFFCLFREKEYTFSDHKYLYDFVKYSATLKTKRCLSTNKV